MEYLPFSHGSANDIQQNWHAKDFSFERFYYLCNKFASFFSKGYLCNAFATFSPNDIYAMHIM